MPLEEITSRIPRIALAGILLSLDQLYNDGLRATDKGKRRAAAEVFLTHLDSASFLKNILSLMPKDPDKPKPKDRVEWGKAKK